MRISDWSSDVCSSDLDDADAGEDADRTPGHRQQRRERHEQRDLRKRADDLDGAQGQRIDEAAEVARDPADDDAEHEGDAHGDQRDGERDRSEEHTSELQSLMRISYAVFCLTKKKKPNTHTLTNTQQ